VVEYAFFSFVIFVQGGVEVEQKNVTSTLFSQPLLSAFVDFMLPLRSKVLGLSFILTPFLKLFITP